MNTNKTNATASKVEAKAQQNNKNENCFMEQVEEAMRHGGIKKALRIIEAQAESGDAHAAYFLGEIYLSGNVCKEDDDKGFHYLMEAANLRHAQALFRLGILSITPKHIQEEKAMVFYFFREAALLGHAEAECLLAVCYGIGYGCECDERMASIWKSKAATDQFDAKLVRKTMKHMGLIKK